MRRTLTRHPDTPCETVSGIAVEVARAGSLLSLKYVVSGDPTGLVLPEPGPPARADGLWKHTCFEAFIRPGGRVAYCEFNMATSRQWAAYGFSAYRHDMTTIEGMAAPSIAVETGPGEVVVEAVIETELPASPLWRVGLSCVIEAADGSISYWALAFPRGKPDFHHADCFALELTETKAP